MKIIVAALFALGAAVGPAAHAEPWTPQRSATPEPAFVFTSTTPQPAVLPVTATPEWVVRAQPVFNLRMPYDDARLGVPTWNIRMPYETQEVMGPHIPTMVLIEHLYKPDVPTLGVVEVPLPPTRPRS